MERPVDDHRPRDRQTILAEKILERRAGLGGRAAGVARHRQRDGANQQFAGRRAVGVEQGRRRVVRSQEIAKRVVDGAERALVAGRSGERVDPAPPAVGLAEIGGESVTQIAAVIAGRRALRSQLHDATEKIGSGQPRLKGLPRATGSADQLVDGRLSRRAALGGRRPARRDRGALERAKVTSAAVDEIARGLRQMNQFERGDRMSVEPTAQQHAHDDARGRGR